MELQQKKYDEGEAKSEALSAEIEKLKSNLEVKETEMKTLHDTLQSIQWVVWVSLFGPTIFRGWFFSGHEIRQR